MKLSNTDLMRLIPVFMQDDEISKAFIFALNSELRKAAAKAEAVRLYANLDNLDEEILDELAWQFNIPEYKKTYEKSTKVGLIKNCLAIHHKRGTVAAITETLKTIFKTAKVEEWFDYGSDPYMFRVRTSNPSANDDMIKAADDIIRATQNIRSHLENVIIDIVKVIDLYVGSIEQSIDDYGLKVDTSPVYMLTICGNNSVAICGKACCYSTIVKEY